MTGQDYFRLAERLANATTEAEWRTAVSRGYYAAFHIARELLLSCNFTVPRADSAHAFLWLRLSNSGHGEVANAGRELQLSRRYRNVADYDFDQPLVQAIAMKEINRVRAIIQALDDAVLEPTKTQITDAIKLYERDVLKQVTWHP